MSAMVVKPAELDVVETQQPAQLGIMKANHNALVRPAVLKAPQKAVQSAAEEKKAAADNLKAQLESVEVGGKGEKGEERKERGGHHCDKCACEWQLQVRGA
jgi:hypothetical protein